MQQNDQPIISRKNAKASGLRYYFTGGQCLNGHVSLRQTVNGRCIECGRIQARDWQRLFKATQPDVAQARRRTYPKACPIKAAARSAAWQAANSDYVKAKAKEYYIANAEVIKKRSKERHHADLEAASQQAKKWRSENPDKVSVNRKMSKARRKARERNVEFEPLTLVDIVARDGLQCYICGTLTEMDAPPRSPRKAEIEHVIPLSRGGGHIASNLRCACFRCNRVKGHWLTPEETREMIRRRDAA